MRLLNTVTEILNFSKLESGNTEVRLTQINLNALLSDEIKLYQVMAAKKGITILEMIPEEAIEIKSDEKFLHEISGNLINNAVKYTSAGSVSVSAFRKKDETVI